MGKFVDSTLKRCYIYHAISLFLILLDGLCDFLDAASQVAPECALVYQTVHLLASMREAQLK